MPVNIYGSLLYRAQKSNLASAAKAIFWYQGESNASAFYFDNFKTLAIWTPTNEAPFICLEPWIGYNDHHDSDYNFYNKDDLIRLAVNEEISVVYQMEIID